MPVRPPHRYRMIAMSQLEFTFGTLPQQKQMELATSIVRQWTCNQGIALVITPEKLFRFRLVQTSEDEHEVGRDIFPNPWVPYMLQHRIDVDDIADILHQLNTCQSAICTNLLGQKLYLRLNLETTQLQIIENPDMDEPV